MPHPLSGLGRMLYDFAITDSLTIRTAERAFEVVMVSVRPKDVTQPRAVGAVYLDRANGSVVRMAFSLARGLRSRTSSSKMSPSFSKTAWWTAASGSRDARRSRFGAQGAGCSSRLAASSAAAGRFAACR